MQKITDIAELEAIYPAPTARATVEKVSSRLTRAYRAWIERSRFCVLTTVGPEGTDASPRGDAHPVVRVIDDKTLALPDRRGNNRIDSLRNIVRDGRVSLMFMIAGSNNVMRVNGRAVLTAEPGLLAGFGMEGKLPRTVTIVTIEEVYPQCARALMRARLWSGEDESGGLPSVGEMMAEIAAGFDGATYDAEWAGRAKETMW